VSARKGGSGYAACEYPSISHPGSVTVERAAFRSTTVVGRYTNDVLMATGMSVAPGLKLAQNRTSDCRTEYSSPPQARVVLHAIGEGCHLLADD
jgi:hypothetical protein